MWEGGERPGGGGDMSNYFWPYSSLLLFYFHWQKLKWVNNGTRRYTQRVSSFCICASLLYDIFGLFPSPPRSRVSPFLLPAVRQRCGLNTERLMVGPTIPILRRRRPRGRDPKMLKSFLSHPQVMCSQHAYHGCALFGMNPKSASCKK